MGLKGKMQEGLNEKISSKIFFASRGELLKKPAEI
jgi:hypothetical protein